MKKPTAIVRDAVNEMLARNDRTRDAVASDRMYLDENFLIVPLKRPVVIEGQWTEVAKTADLFDLMDDYQAGR